MERRQVVELIEGLRSAQDGLERAFKAFSVLETHLYQELGRRDAEEERRSRDAEEDKARADAQTQRTKEQAAMVLAASDALRGLLLAAVKHTAGSKADKAERAEG